MSLEDGPRPAPSSEPRDTELSRFWEEYPPTRPISKPKIQTAPNSDEPKPLPPGIYHDIFDAKPPISDLSDRIGLNHKTPDYSLNLPDPVNPVKERRIPFLPQRAVVFQEKIEV